MSCKSSSSIEKPKNSSLPKIVAAVDVRNPLLGENGATRVFGPQKGASEDKIDILERALAKLADVVSKEFGVDYRDEPGAGAAGGLGFGLMSFCGAKIRPGFEVVAEAVDLESKMRNADVVITGEGSLDRQTLEGKTLRASRGSRENLGSPFSQLSGARSKIDRCARFSMAFTRRATGNERRKKTSRAAEFCGKMRRSWLKQS